MENTTYENAMAQLKELGKQLESGELTLDESLEVYAKAVDLIKICNKKLQETQKQMLDGKERIPHFRHLQFRFF